MCNSTDVVKQDGFFVCQSCGTKYSVEEAKKMMIEGTVDVQGTVEIDNSAFVEKYLANARRAKDKEDWPETEKYYNMVEQNDPTNIEAIFYSAFARVKTALLEAETREKRQSVFNILEKSVSVIDDNYDNTNEEHHKLLFKIMDDLDGLEHGAFVPTTHLQEYVTKNGYGSIVDRNQIVENDSEFVTDRMIYRVIDVYAESLSNIIAVECENLSKEDILDKARETFQNGYSHFAKAYFCEYTNKNPNSPIGYLGEALAINSSAPLKKATNCTVLDDKEEDLLDYILDFKKDDIESLLLGAAMSYNYEGVKCLVELGVDINAAKRCGENHPTALWYVCHDTPSADNVGEARKIAKLLLDKGARIDVKGSWGCDLYNYKTDPAIKELIKAKFPNATIGTTSSTGCYVATCVYGSYDCPEVWTLRRYRDYTLDATWYGRMFIKTYYAVSPTIVKWFGNTSWFKKLWKGKLDRMVSKLQEQGYESTRYNDKY